MRLEEYVKMRNKAVIEAVDHGNITPLRKFAKRIGQPIPSCEVLLIVAHKMCCNIPSMGTERQQRSREWLKSLSFSPEIKNGELFPGSRQDK